MINGNLLLNRSKEVEIKGKKFTLKQPKVIDFIEYSIKNFDDENDISERIRYLFDLFEIEYKYFSEELLDVLHNHLMNYENKKEKSNNEEIKKSGYIIKDIDFVYVIGKFMNFYKYTHEQILQMPLNLFFELNSKIEVIQSEETLRIIDLYAVPSYLKTNEGVELVQEIKKECKEKVEKVYELELIDNSIEDYEKFRELFKGSNLEVGSIIQNGGV